MKRFIFLVVVLVLGVSCTDTTDDGPNIGNGALDDPDGVLLVFPSDNELCNEGEDLTPTESTVFFEWEPNDNAVTYLLNIENLGSGEVVQYETEDFIFPARIARAEAFRWFVDYTLQGEVKQSAIWNFYNAGPGVQTYAPFPADLIFPTMAQNIPSTNSITLDWSGSDVDDDIIGYDIYFDTNNPPGLNTSNTSANQFTVPVSPETIYYWKIVTKDATGHTSESVIYQFRIL